jgi:hypothetical protein
MLAAFLILPNQLDPDTMRKPAWKGIGLYASAFHPIFRLSIDGGAPPLGKDLLPNRHSPNIDFAQFDLAQNPPLKRLRIFHRRSVTFRLWY